ncbi:hypothetical protein ACOMHN_023905 [Nucella lapillus]
MGIANPAHIPSDDIELTKLTRRPSTQRDHSEETNNRREIPDGAPQSPTKGSDVFGVCCSASGHVPVAAKEEEGNDDVIICDVNDDVEGNKKGHTLMERQLGIEYSVVDVPPIHMCFLFGLQQVLLSISSTISIPLIVSKAICAGELTLVKSEIMSTFLFMCGVCTILQVLIGVR